MTETPVNKPATVTGNVKNSSQRDKHRSQPYSIPKPSNAKLSSVTAANATPTDSNEINNINGSGLDNESSDGSKELDDLNEQIRENESLIEDEQEEEENQDETDGEQEETNRKSLELGSRMDQEDEEDQLSSSEADEDHQSGGVTKTSELDEEELEEGEKAREDGRYDEISEEKYLHSSRKKLKMTTALADEN